MTEQTLQQGQNLQNRLTAAQETLYRWQNADSFYNSRINVYTQYKDGDRIYRVDRATDVEPNTFTIVKAINVAYWQGVVDDLQKQFDAL